MLADLLTTLERLIALGFSPFLALIIGFMIVLAATIASLAAFGWKAITRERSRHDNLLADRDKERVAERLQIEHRLAQSEVRHQSCESDRETLRGQLSELKVDVARLKSCPKRDCPMRLPQ